MDCIDYFYRLIARREYSVAELINKGKEKDFAESEIHEAIAELQAKGYQSDHRLVENRILSGTGKYGKSLLKRKCLEKGIPGYVFEEVWSAHQENGEPIELDHLKDKVMRKYHLESFANIDQKTKAKVINYLQYRGFNAFQLLKDWQIEE